MKHFCLSLPDGLQEKIAAVCQQRSITITSYIRGAVAARLQSDMTGQRFCSEGSPCILALMPDYSQLASSSRMLLDSPQIKTLNGKKPA